MISEYIKIELECGISVSDTVLVTDVIPKAIIFYDPELIDWAITNAKIFRMAGLQIHIHGPPIGTHSFLPPLNLEKFNG